MALAGMERVLTCNPGLKLFMEFWPTGLVRCGSDPLKLLDKLAGFNYRLEILDEATKMLKKLDEPGSLA